jgi:hypothetical protein
VLNHRLTENSVDNDLLFIFVVFELILLLVESGLIHRDSVTKEQSAQLLLLFSKIVRCDLVQPKTDVLVVVFLLFRLLLVNLTLQSQLLH